jgi:hypothetical protein
MATRINRSNTVTRWCHSKVERMVAVADTAPLWSRGSPSRVVTRSSDVEAPAVAVAMVEAIGAGATVGLDVPGGAPVGLAVPGGPMPASTVAWCTQPRSAVSVRSRSRATYGTERSPTRQRRTASALNSGVNARLVLRDFCFCCFVIRHS